MNEPILESLLAMLANALITSSATTKNWVKIAKKYLILLNNNGKTRYVAYFHTLNLKMLFVWKSSFKERLITNRKWA